MSQQPPARPESSWPGFQSPSVGFEQPFDMLLACHDRVRRSLDLLERLADHVRQNGTDSAAQSAASDVLRYFDLAAPLHHQDEERHVLPALRASESAPLIALADQIEAEHQELHGIWAELRTVLLEWQKPESPSATDLARQIEKCGPLIARYTALYRVHAAEEERLAFPSAAQRIPLPQLASMGAEMAARRRS